MSMKGMVMELNDDKFDFKEILKLCIDKRLNYVKHALAGIYGRSEEDIDVYVMDILYVDEHSVVMDVKASGSFIISTIMNIRVKHKRKDLFKKIEDNLFNNGTINQIIEELKEEYECK